MNDDLLPQLVDAIEQQIVSPQTPYVAKTLKRLTSLGLEESEAKTQMAMALAQEMDDVVRKKRSFDESAYRKLLDSLPLAEDVDEEDEDLEDPELD